MTNRTLTLSCEKVLLLEIDLEIGIPKEDLNFHRGDALWVTLHHLSCIRNLTSSDVIQINQETFTTNRIKISQLFTQSNSPVDIPVEPLSILSKPTKFDVLKPLL